MTNQLFLDASWLHDRQVFLKTFVASNIYWSGFLGMLTMAWYHPCTTGLLFTPCIQLNHPRPNWSLLQLPCWKRSGVRDCRPIARIAWSVRTERNNRGTEGLSEEFKKLKKCVCLFVFAFFSPAFEVPFVLFRIKIAKTEFSVWCHHWQSHRKIILPNTAPTNRRICLCKRNMDWHNSDFSKGNWQKKTTVISLASSV